MTTFQLLAALFHVVVAAGVSAHIVLTKSDVRGAIGWVGLVWLTPVIGSVLYFFLGINRIRRAAGRMRTIREIRTAERLAAGSGTRSGALAPPGWDPLGTLTGAISPEPLTPGNRVVPLQNGDEAYPAMLEAIDGATRSVALLTYIFDRGKVADRFVEALAQAVRRGVEVRVLIDGVGARYSRPSILADLRARGVTVAEFIPSPFPFAHPYFNLRNHRKVLVVDGMLGFTGGLNIRDACVLAGDAPEPTRDIHFRFTGPVVHHLADVFAFDWRFATGEILDGGVWFPTIHPDPAGDVVARGIPDGPDESYEALLLTLLGALSQARRTVRIVTPYFLPDQTLIDALRVTALRGVDVRIYLPERGNLRLVQWAQQAQLTRILRGGCRVFLTAAPFDHSKLMVVDEEWSLVGSANWDPRSLRLNFEYVVECYSSRLAAALGALITTKEAGARELRRADLLGRPIALRVRDGAAWLMQPYL